jgi:NADH:ubiquinone oxidoreductase subunit F (NADH-binding)
MTVLSTRPEVTTLPQRWDIGRLEAAVSVTCRLLAVQGAERPLTWPEHMELHGPLPVVDSERFLAELAFAGLTGRGGAGFPVERKMRAVLAGPAPRIVIGNGAEGEPASAKDKTLLSTNPHLVLDGIQVAARVTAATRAFIYVHEETSLIGLVREAIEERRRHGVDGVQVELVSAPAHFVSGEESAVASRVSGGLALPQPKPPRVFEVGAFGRPTLVSNVESLAHLAQIARHGAAAFSAVGHPEQPGTMLFTVSGAVLHPRVVEAPTGVRLSELIDAAGGLALPPAAVLLGGFHGSWIPWPQARDLVMANPVLRDVGLSVGAGVIVVLPATVCGLSESVRVLDYLAASSAGQCGPCVFGMPKIAGAFAAAVDGGGPKALGRLADLAPLLERRGGCSHPDGSLRFLRSTITTFADELASHAHGICSSPHGQPVLPTGEVVLH